MLVASTRRRSSQLLSIGLFTCSIENISRTRQYRPRSPIHQKLEKRIETAFFAGDNLFVGEQRTDRL
jgi:hypothetical protein